MKEYILRCLACGHRFVPAPRERCALCHCEAFGVVKGLPETHRFQVFVNGSPTGYCTDRINDALEKLRSYTAKIKGRGSIHMTHHEAHIVYYNSKHPRQISIWASMFEPPRTNRMTNDAIAFCKWNTVEKTGL